MITSHAGSLPQRRSGRNNKQDTTTPGFDPRSALRSKRFSLRKSLISSIVRSISRISTPGDGGSGEAMSSAVDLLGALVVVLIPAPQ